jgi:hypothetical protein
MTDKLDRVPEGPILSVVTGSRCAIAARAVNIEPLPGD